MRGEHPLFKVFGREYGDYTLVAACRSTGTTLSIDLPDADDEAAKDLARALSGSGRWKDVKLTVERDVPVDFS